VPEITGERTVQRNIPNSSPLSWDISHVLAQWVVLVGAGRPLRGSHSGSQPYKSKFTEVGRNPLWKCERDDGTRRPGPMIRGARSVMRVTWSGDAKFLTHTARDPATTCAMQSVPRMAHLQTKVSRTGTRRQHKKRRGGRQF